LVVLDGEEENRQVHTPIKELIMPEQVKTTVDTFKQRLNNGDYQSLTSALKAVGRVNGWKEKEREDARALAQKHFGSSGKPAAAPKPKAAPKKAAGKKTKEPKEAKEPKEKVTRRRRDPLSLNSDSLEPVNYNTPEGVVHVISKTLEQLAVAKSLGAPEEGIVAAAQQAQKALSECIAETIAIAKKYSVQTLAQPVAASEVNGAAQSPQLTV
jgi:hypothetical protein